MVSASKNDAERSRIVVFSLRVAALDWKREYTDSRARLRYLISFSRTSTVLLISVNYAAKEILLGIMKNLEVSIVS